MTQDYAMKKVIELDEYQKFIDTQIIQNVHFVNYNGAVAVLGIVGDPKEKKSKKKKVQTN